MPGDVAIKVDNVSKTFKLPHEKHTSIKSAIINFGRTKRGYEKQKVLNGISFEVKKGQFFGIVGRNGSGKSTLLKLLAGIYTPDAGNIQINGKLTPFIELGVGFNPELSGRENVFLNGALLGFSRKEMEALYDEIVEFAELERFMDQKLKNYSSGMQVRLAFSIAIRAQSDILVLDEVLAVGDEAFQRKCFDYFAQLKIAKKTVVLVTHSMESVIRFCDSAMLLQNGSIAALGDTQKVTTRYEEINRGMAGVLHKKTKGDDDPTNDFADVKISILDKENQPTRQVFAEDVLRIKAEIRPHKPLQDVFLGLSLHKPSGEAVFVKTTEKKNETLPALEPNSTTCVTYEIQNIFAEDTYYVNISVKSNDRTTVYLTKEDLAQFQVIASGLHRSSLRPDYKIKIEKK